MSAYNPSIPQPTDLLSNSQQQILNNFGSLDSTFAINHFKFSDGTANLGKHNFSEYVSRTPLMSPIAPCIAGEVSLYAIASGQTQLYATSDAGGQQYQLTRCIDASFGTFKASNPGWTFLPGGMLLQYGQATSSGTTFPNTTVTFPVTYTGVVFSVNCTIITTVDSRFFVEIYDLSNNQFRAVTRDSAGTKISGISFSWMAIGV